MLPTNSQARAWGPSGFPSAFRKPSPTSVSTRAVPVAVPKPRMKRVILVGLQLLTWYGTNPLLWLSRTKYCELSMLAADSYNLNPEFSQRC
jgi:hypothetical protein